MQLFFKIKSFCLSLSRYFLDNGSGRAVPVKDTDSGPGDPSGFSLLIKEIVDSITGVLLSIGEFLIRCATKLLYFFIKLALNIMDFMNILIKELSGQATAYSVKNNASLEDTDILFKFMFNDYTIRILRTVFIFALLLLIIFTIMAIVKQEWQNFITGKQNEVKRVLRKTVISIFHMLFVPFILIIGIIFSNVILSSAMNAVTGGNGSFSLGAQLFSTSSYEANRYRNYALTGKKIPIVFDYDGGFENAVSTEIPDLSEDSTGDYDNQVNNMINGGELTAGLNTNTMFKEKTFYDFSAVSANNNYYNIYDGPYLKTQQIEYFVMADFLDFAMESGGTFYVVNTEKVFMTTMNYLAGLESYPNPTAPGIEKDSEEYNQLYFQMTAIEGVINNITAYDEENRNIAEINPNDTWIDVAKSVTANTSDSIVLDRFTFKSYFDSQRASVSSTINLDDEGGYQYESIAGSTDEVTGAKYLLCHKIQMNDAGDFIYLPVRLGDEVNGFDFKSEYLEPAPLSDDGVNTIRSESLFIARGIFTSKGYPTAIREDGNVLVYYRHDPQSPSAVNYAEIFNYQTATTTDSGSGSGGVASIIEFFTGLDVSHLVPDISINLNFIKAFTKGEVRTAGLEGGKFSVNYSFVGSDMKLTNLYDELKINYIVLVFAVVSIFMSLFLIIIGLIRRIFEITLLWITYPGWIAKFPIEDKENIGQNGTAYSQWKDKMVERVLALFAIYLGLAIVLLLIPVVFKMDFITTYNIEETNVFAIFNADVANLAIKVAFIIVLFNFLNITKKDGKGKDLGTYGGAPQIIDSIVLWSGNAHEGYLAKVGSDTIKDIKSLSSKAVATFTPWGLKDTIKDKALDFGRSALNAIPGKAIADRVIDHNPIQALMRSRNDKMLKKEQENLLSKTNESDIASAASSLESATSDHSYIEGYQQAHKDYMRQTGDGSDKDFRKDRGQHKNRLFNVSKKGGGVKFKVGNKNKKERYINIGTRFRRKV